MIKHFLPIAALILTLLSCQLGWGELVDTEPRTEVSALIAEATADVSAQRYDTAMDKALRALEISRQDGSALGQVQALTTIVGIDIITSRDTDAWEKALEAEALARKQGYSKELAAILISKAKLCSYAEISPETGRNDEGLEYAQEALALAEEAGAIDEQCEACYVIGSLYINKNRWNDPIDPDIYRSAGEWLDKGQALADTYDLPRLRRNGILFRSRWFQQGDRNEEAIHYFEQVRSTLKDSDHLTASSLDDRLVRLYTRTGDYEKALDTHDDYVLRMQQYIQQKQDETLQEMETRFQVQEKERALERNRYRTALLLLALLLVAAGLFLLLSKLKTARRRNAELQKINDSKEQLIEFLSRDLRNPASACSTKLEELSGSAPRLSDEEIRRQIDRIARDARTLNTEVADYVGNVLIERARLISDIGLSQREIQIIRLSAEGLRASEIADRLFLSVNTVNTHRKRIYAKMNVRNVSDLIRQATELGII
ncbi:MAG: response regulator transcription factor [Bacteroidales bacterium]|nr:response regulator transcription factor [Bacteroidales bacterium]MDO5000168.1 response regulator transcription factor [Bacteroidales bacterium]